MSIEDGNALFRHLQQMSEKDWAMVNAKLVMLTSEEEFRARMKDIQGALGDSEEWSRHRQSGTRLHIAAKELAMGHRTPQCVADQNIWHIDCAVMASFAIGEVVIAAEEGLLLDPYFFRKFLGLNRPRKNRKQAQSVATDMQE